MLVVVIRPIRHRVEAEVRGAKPPELTNAGRGIQAAERSGEEKKKNPPWSGALQKSSNLFILFFLCALSFGSATVKGHWGRGRPWFSS